MSEPLFDLDDKVVTVTDTTDKRLQFQLEPLGPEDYRHLREEPFPNGFDMPTVGELVSFYHVCALHRDCPMASKALKYFEGFLNVGTTLTLLSRNGYYVVDRPLLEDDGEPVLDEDTLKGKLGGHEEEGIVFSNDGSLRYLPYEKMSKRTSYSQSELRQNMALIALLGGRNRVEKFIESSPPKVRDYLMFSPFIGTKFDEARLPEVALPALHFGINRLLISKTYHKRRLSEYRFWAPILRDLGKGEVAPEDFLKGQLLTYAVKRLDPQDFQMV